MKRIPLKDRLAFRGMLGGCARAADGRCHGGRGVAAGTGRTRRGVAAGAGLRAAFAYGAAVLSASEFGRGALSFLGSLPARLRASRKIHSTWPLALRISSSAQRWTASHMTGSMRRGYCLRAMFLSSLSQRLSQAPHLGVQSSGTARQTCALLFRPNLQHLEKAYKRVDISTGFRRSAPDAPRTRRTRPPSGCWPCLPCARHPARWCLRRPSPSRPCRPWRRRPRQSSCARR